MSEPGKTVAIVGAGIVGVSAAVWLQREGHRVILIDRAGPGEGASLGNGGVLAASAIVPVAVPGLLLSAPAMLVSPNQPLFLRWRYLPRLLPWLARFLARANAADARRTAAAMAPIIGDSLADHQALAAGTGAERWIRPSDYLYLYGDRAGFAADAFGWELRRANGFVWDELDRAALAAAEPALSPALGFAARLRGHGHITDPGRYVKDLAAHVLAGGGKLITAGAEDVVRENGRVTGLRAGGETIPCDATIIAAGAHSGPLARRLGVRLPLETQRGYHLDLWEPSVMPRAPVMVTTGKFVMTPMEGRLRLAGVVELGGLDAPPARVPFALLKRQALAALPGLSWRHAEEWMGHRPTLADSIPVIGAPKGISGAYLAFGHHHVGLTGGPRTGQLLAQLLSGKAPNIDLAPYAPSRFQG